jgi:hypothetical protein
MRWGWVALVAVGLTLGACGGDGDGDGETPAPTRPAATTQAQDQARFDGSWTGRTSQGKALSFTVTNGAVTQVSIAYDYGGPNCNIVNTRLSGRLRTPIKITGERFSIRAFGDEVFAGRFGSPMRASGTGHFEPPARDRPGCRTADITWNARR